MLRLIRERITIDDGLQSRLRTLPASFSPIHCPFIGKIFLASLHTFIERGTERVHSLLRKAADDSHIDNMKVDWDACKW